MNICCISLYPRYSIKLMLMIDGISHFSRYMTCSWRFTWLSVFEAERKPRWSAKPCFCWATVVRPSNASAPRPGGRLWILSCATSRWRSTSGHHRWKDRESGQGWRNNDKDMSLVNKLRNTTPFQLPAMQLLWIATQWFGFHLDNLWSRCCLHYLNLVELVGYS